LLRVKSMIRYLPPKGTAGFALSADRILKRSLAPPAKIMANTLFMVINLPLASFILIVAKSLFIVELKYIV
jgi:hypothetical protein